MIATIRRKTQPVNVLGEQPRKMTSPQNLPVHHDELRVIPSRVNPSFSATAIIAWSVGPGSPAAAAAGRAPGTHSGTGSAPRRPETAPRKAGTQRLPTCADRLCRSTARQHRLADEPAGRQFDDQKIAAPVPAAGELVWLGALKAGHPEREYAGPDGIGTEGRKSDRIRVATSSYSSACKISTSSTARARKPVNSPLSMSHSYQPVTSSALRAGRPVSFR